MPIIHYPGYLTKEEAAIKHNVQLRTIRDRIRRKAIEHIKVDGQVFVKDNFNRSVQPENISPASLEWVSNFAERHNMTAERVYVEIIMGKISGVIIANRIFVIRNEPELLSFIENSKKR